MTASKETFRMYLCSRQRAIMSFQQFLALMRRQPGDTTK